MSVHQQDEICRICDMLYQRDLIVGPSGNVSARLDENRILLTPWGVMKYGMHPDRLFIVGILGNSSGPQTEARQGIKPSSEQAMRLEVYRRRKVVGAIVHAHSSTVVALLVTGVPIRPNVHTEDMFNDRGVKYHFLDMLSKICSN